MTYTAVPGLVETKEAYGETTLVVDPARLLDAARYLRDELGFSFLSDVTATDYLGWGDQAVAGYIGTAAGRDLNRPGSHGLAHRRVNGRHRSNAIKQRADIESGSANEDRHPAAAVHIGNLAPRSCCPICRRTGIRAIPGAEKAVFDAAHVFR